jgi:hypothetical protein
VGTEVHDAAPTKRLGRPRKLNRKLALKICEYLVEGKSLRWVTNQAEMPKATTLFRWLDEDLAFREQYARAKQMGLELQGEDIIDIADTPMIGQRLKKKADGTVEQIAGDNVERSKLRVDARKWVLSKLLPKKYGDKLIAPVSDGLNPQLKALADALNAGPVPKGETNE